MDENTERAVELLVDAVEADDDGNPRYSGKENVKIRDCLMPELIEHIDLNPQSLRVSEGLLNNKIDAALLSAKDSSDVIETFETELEVAESDIRDREVSEHIVAFPLNFDRRDSDLISDELSIGETTFTRLSKGTWQSEIVPSFDNLSDIDEFEWGSPDYYRMRLRDFLDESPNDISPRRATFWKASFYARDERYAVDAVIDALSVLLGELNYAMQYSQSEGMSSRSGPWPARWSDLRHPFVYLVFDADQEFLNFYYDSEDASPRDEEGPHSMYEEAFEKVFKNTPNFTDNRPLDGYLKKAFRAYQSALSNPSQREAFFELWRAVEILSLVEPEQPTKTAVERSEGLFDWNNPDLIDLRTHRAIRKRNEHVHDGQESEITVRDKNLVKLLADGLLDHYIERRDEWNEEQMRFSLEKFTVDENSITVLKQNREDELEVLEWMENIADQN